MNAVTKTILLKHDEKGRYETPTRFDWNRLKDQTRHLATELERHFGISFLIEDQVQDASFYFDIKIPKELVMNNRPNVCYSIRISNFGGLATMLQPSAHTLETQMAIRRILKQHHFEFIAIEDLEELYDGKWKEFKAIIGDGQPTWFARYFDY